MLCEFQGTFDLPAPFPSSRKRPHLLGNVPSSKRTCGVNKSCRVVTPCVGSDQSRASHGDPLLWLARLTGMALQGTFRALPQGFNLAVKKSVKLLPLGMEAVRCEAQRRLVALFPNVWRKLDC